MYISDIIQTDYKCWRGGSAIFIDAPTGVGKTTFVLETLLSDACSHGKSVLYLCNRDILVQQIKVQLMKRQNLSADEIDIDSVYEFDGISVMSYQKLQNKQTDARELFLSNRRWKYIVYDEIHYLLEDAPFNPRTGLLLESIKQRTSINVFLSATLDGIFELITEKMYGDKFLPRPFHLYENKPLDLYIVNTVISQIESFNNHYPVYDYKVWYYTIPRQKRDISVFYYEQMEDILTLLDTDGKEKWLIFDSNKKDADILKERICAIISDCVKILSAEKRDKEVISDILNQEKYNERVLITTKILDNGVTLKDFAIRNIVIDTISKTEFIQMLGRKRIIGKEDTINLYIPKKSLKVFTDYQNLNVRKNLNFLTHPYDKKELLMKLDVDEKFRELFFQFLYYDEQKDLHLFNQLAVTYYKRLATFLDDMICRMKDDEWAFVKQQLQWLGMEADFNPENDIHSILIHSYTDELLAYLESVSEQELNQSSQHSIREKVGEWAFRMGYFNTKKNSPGKLKINTLFQQKNIPYTVTSIKGHKKGEQSRWKIVKE